MIAGNVAELTADFQRLASWFVSGAGARTGSAPVMTHLTRLS
jgi:hypothetical protein